MSACIFMVGRDFLESKTDQELEDKIAKWQKFIDKADTSNIFDRDVAGGYLRNIHLARWVMVKRTPEVQKVAEYHRVDFYHYTKMEKSDARDADIDNLFFYGYILGKWGGQ